MGTHLHGHGHRLCDTARRRAAELLVLALLLVLGAAAPLRGATVAPRALFLGDERPTGSVVIANPDAVTVEVTIGFRFGLMETDRQGNARLRWAPVSSPDPRSAAGWVRAHPRRLRLRPGQQQVVRVRAHPPRGLPAREYWSRVVVRITPVPGGGSAAGGGSIVRQGSEQTLPLFFRHGALATAARLEGVRAARDAKTGAAVLLLDLSCRGSAAYLGRVFVEVLDAGGRPFARRTGRASIFRTLTRRFPLGRPWEPGTYAVRVRLDTENERVPPSERVRGAPVDRTVRLVIPASRSGADPDAKQ